MHRSPSKLKIRLETITQPKKEYPEQERDINNLGTTLATPPPPEPTTQKGK
ncbi:unnamed protein product [Penicillium camemberti]|uniref:Str. FM013 n=1 Tax=Penicillium camemberti (strain FM 013) TaxID=1429867 RepID=A0A0G4PGE6_PENC3|nr:unnamed protein product [Penicillium camemberti]